MLSKGLRKILFLSCLCFYLVLFMEQYEVCFDGIILMDNLLIFNHYEICFNSRFIFFYTAFIILFEEKLICIICNNYSLKSQIAYSTKYFLLCKHKVYYKVTFAIIFEKHRGTDFCLHLVNNPF